MVTDGSFHSADAVANCGGVSSPQSQRRTPWASVVRGGSEKDSSPTAVAATSPGSSVDEASPSDNSFIESSGSEPQPEQLENYDDSYTGGPRRSAWNRQLNGVAEPASVMGGAVSWPTLSETKRLVPRSSSDASRPVSDGVAPSSQSTIISQPPQRLGHSNAHGSHGNFGGNNPNSGRLRRNRGGGGGGSSSGSGSSQSTFNQPTLPMPPPFPVFEVPFGMIPAVLDNSLRGPRPIGGVGASQSPTSNDHSTQRSNSRRNNYGPRPRGDGQYHNNYGGWRDQDRREVHHPPRYAAPPMGYMPPPLPPGAAPFMAPPPMRAIPGQIGFDMASPFFYVPPMPLESFRTMPIVPPLSPLIFPPAKENSLTNMIVKQIDFYFSDDNLVKDGYLRSNMDDHGWVPISLIASFRRVEQLTKDIPVILESLRYSMVVEVQGDKVRRRNEWSKWVLSNGVVNSDSASGPSSSVPENALAISLQEVSMDDTLARANGNLSKDGHMEIAAGQLPVDLTNQSVLANGDNTDVDHSISL
ncbi:hypothetical protein AAHA92_12655 [Salvia divinorum]|uniref:HTH La-type RNA-binding domain-containing protein n=1 Tax=Salvia divinorum TaxID=28513 RepID=A0ABD1HKY5_SALDI